MSTAGPPRRRWRSTPRGRTRATHIERVESKDVSPAFESFGGHRDYQVNTTTGAAGLSDLGPASADDTSGPVAGYLVTRGNVQVRACHGSVTCPDTEGAFDSESR